MSKVHTLVILRNGKVSTQFTGSTIGDLENYIPVSMMMELKEAVHYGQSKFYQGDTKYNLMYSCWEVME